MRAFTRSVVTGFAFSLGAALFRRVAPSLGLDDKSKKDAAGAGASDSSQGDGTDGAREPSPLQQTAEAARAWIGRAASRARNRGI
jgi:hypothetical protein